MTSKLTRLTDDELAETLRLATSGYPLSSSTEANLRHAFTELQERRKAAMDSKPVAYMYDGEDSREYNGHNEFSGGGKGIPLYRHAQQPVVPDEKDKTVDADDHPLLWSFNEGWNACRAAMLQAQSDDDGEPTDDERIMAIEGIHNCERCGDEGWVVGEMGITRCACGQAGNSPAQSYCSPAQNSVAPEQSPIDHGYRPDCECTGCKATARICAELAGWIPVSERMPEESGRYWCYVEEQNSLGKSHYQWNCSWNGDVWSDKALTGRVTHWKPLPAAPQEVKGE